MNVIHVLKLSVHVLNTSACDGIKKAQGPTGLHKNYNVYCEQ